MSCGMTESTVQIKNIQARTRSECFKSTSAVAQDWDDSGQKAWYSAHDKQRISGEHGQNFMDFCGGSLGAFCIRVVLMCMCVFAQVCGTT